MPGSVHVAKTRDHLYDDLAFSLLNAAKNAVDQRGVAHIALSGGSTPEPFYMRLVLDIRFRKMPWEHTHVWIVDERRVPEDDPQSNYRMIRETLLDHVPTKRRQVHPMPVMVENPAEMYEAELTRVFAQTAEDHSEMTNGAANNGSAMIPRLDFVVLGMGADAHTASLFPSSPALAESNRWIACNDGPNVTPPPRVTMTFPLLNAARRLAILITGGKKAATLQRIADQLRDAGPDVQSLPVTGLIPRLDHDDEPTLRWYLDPEAAGQTIELEE